MKITNEMVEKAWTTFEEHSSYPSHVARMRRALEAVLRDKIVSRWDAFSDEELDEINAGASERADKLSLPEEIRQRAERIYNETVLERRRRKGGYQGPGVYKVSSGREFEVLGRHGADGPIVLREAEDTSGFLYLEAWGDFNYGSSDGTPAYRYLRPLGEN